jgi:hypothetical protein
MLSPVLHFFLFLLGLLPAFGLFLGPQLIAVCFWGLCREIDLYLFKCKLDGDELFLITRCRIWMVDLGQPVILVLALVQSVKPIALQYTQIVEMTVLVYMVLLLEIAMVTSKRRCSMQKYCSINFVLII